MATKAEAPPFRPGLERPGRRALSLSWVATVPFFAYAVAFLIFPATWILFGAFKTAAGGWTLRNIRNLFQGQFLHAYETSLEISLLTAATGTAFGLLIAYSAIREGTPRWIRTTITTFSGVAANFAGVPLAFAFIATLGTIGVVTRFIQDVFHVYIYSHSFWLIDIWGLALAYTYFQIPLMILVIAPAIDGLRREWREAASNLGSTASQYWRYVGLPVLFPSMLGAFILLFGNAFSAYATAYALTSGRVSVVPVLIGQVLTGNVLSDPQMGYALALGMFVVLAAMMLLYWPLQRRAARWRR